MKNKMGGACGVYGREKSTYMVLVVRPEGKRPLGRSRGRCDIKWILWRAVVSAVMNVRVP
jgi:hypothetical protein